MWELPVDGFDRPHDRRTKGSDSRTGAAIPVMKTAEIRIDLFVQFVRESIGQWSWFGGVDGFRATTPPPKKKDRMLVGGGGF